MLKVTVLGHKPVTENVIEALQHVGVLQVQATQFDLELEPLASDDPRLRTFDEQIADALFVRDFLAHYHVNDQPFSTFISEKFHLGRDDYLALDFDARMRHLYHECVRLSDEMATAQRENARLEQLIFDLRPWEDFKLQISRWKGTDRTHLFTGTVPAANGPDIRQKLRERVSEVTVEELGAIDDRQAWVVIAHRSHTSEVRAVLAGTEFTEISFPGLSDYPAEEIARARDGIAEHAERSRLARERAQVLSDENHNLVVALVAALESQRDRVAVRRDFGTTERVFAISGWVLESQADELHRALEPFESAVDITLEAPGPDDDVPVALDNPRWLKPFEVLTDLYGRPRYGEIDPTGLLAPFFLIFFAICIGDVGYGAMLAVACWLIKTRLDVAPGVKRFMDLMIYGGIAAMFVGVAFGSYFAIPVENLPTVLAGLQVLDPLNELTTFLLATLVLGVIQVFFGVFVSAYDAFRRGDPQEAVFGQLSTIFMFAMIAAFVVTGQAVLLSVGLVGTMIMQGRAIQRVLGDPQQPAWDRAIGWAWLAAVAVSTVMMGTGAVAAGLGVLGGACVAGAVISKTARDGVIGLLGGVYAVYGMSGFVGDTLSYTRLAALGLSGSLVGMVFNVLAGLVWAPAMALFGKGGLGVAGGVVVAVLAAAIFVVGHVFNVVINLLGAFVHPARLQFVEFFSKFYEAGGRPFAPFAVRSENLVLEAGQTGSEGGAG